MSCADFLIIYTQAVFNIVFCYFPISFRPPPNDPYGISADDLKMALRFVAPLIFRFSNIQFRFYSSCLCATPLFGPLAIPVYLEKLTAGSPSSKVTNSLDAISDTYIFPERYSSKHVSIFSSVRPGFCPPISPQTLEFIET